MSLLKQIPASEFKGYANSIRACQIGAVCVMEGRFGILNLDFSDFKDATICKFNMRRVSGNGIITVISGANTQNEKITSKVSQYLSIDISEHKIIELRRSILSIGNIEIIEVDLFADKIEGSMGKNTLRDALAKCKSYKSVRLAQGRLFAAEGGVIEGDIISITTNPPNVYKIQEGRAKFITNCQVTELIIGNTEFKNKTPYKHVAPPLEIVSEQGAHTNAITHVPTKLVKKHQDTPMTTPNMKIMYDSLKNNFNGLSLNAQAKISADGRSIRLEYKGSVSIPIAAIEPSQEYITTIEVNKVNGNGKVMSYIAPASTGKSAMIFATPHRNTVNMAIQSGQALPEVGKSYRLVIERPESATGDVIISRIMFMEGLNINIQQASASIAGYRPPKPIVNHVSYGLKIESDDNVFISAKRFCRYQDTFTTQSTIDNIDGVITVTSVSGLSWYSKVKPFIPNVTLNQNLDYASKTLLVGSLGSLVFAKSILLDEFLLDNIDESDDKVLQAAERIFSPSSPNVDLLRNKYPNADVKLVHRPWPFAEPMPLPHIKSKYILAFNRSNYTTKLVLDAWNKDMPQLIIVGGRGKYPSNVLCTNEYLPYKNLIYLISNAMCIVDLPLVNDYMSSIQRMAQVFGVPVTTTNWCAMDNPKASFIVTEYDYKDFRVPSVENVRAGIQAALDIARTPEDIGEYNNYVTETLSSLFG